MCKKEWKKPEVIKVKLIPEESVLWGCKIVLNAVARNGWFGSCIVFNDSCNALSS